MKWFFLSSLLKIFGGIELKVYVVVDSRKKGRAAIVAVTSSSCAAVDLKNFYNAKENVKSFQAHFFEVRNGKEMSNIHERGE